MKNSIKIVFFFYLTFCACINAQEQNSDKSLISVVHYESINQLPKISKDSTSNEITTHVDATLDWMTEELYKFNYAPTLIYSEKALSLAKKSNNKQHIHDVRAVIGNTLIRVKDTIRAKELFLESLEDAKRTNDSSLILKSKGNLANLYYFTDGYKSKTIKIYLESIEIAKRLEDTTRLFVLHHNLSRAFNESQKPEESAYHIAQTEFYLNLLGNPPHYLASHFHNKGRMYLLLNKHEDAIYNFKQTIALCENTEFVEALMEGYIGYKDALEINKDYKGVYEISKKLEVYKDKINKDEARNIMEAVSAKLNAERFKDQIKSKELERELLEEQAENRGFIIFIVLGILALISIICLQTYKLNKKHKVFIVDLKNKNAQYLEAKQQSDELTKSKAKFFATVSHELRTPLYGVIGLSSILLENKELKSHEEDLKSLKFSANYLLALVNDLLHINKIENNGFVNEEITFNLKDLLTTIVSSFEYIRIQHNNEIEIIIDDNVPLMLKGNSVRLSQILMNLIGNACKFTEKGSIRLSVLQLETIPENLKIQFKVEDTGPGIEKHKLNEIFDEFSQVDQKQGSTIYQGTGLGLPIVKKLVEQCNGNIIVESEIGKGTSFQLDLELKLPSESESKLIKPILDFKQLEQKRILIVEDNRINQTVTKRILENAQVVCQIAQNGEEAITFAQQYSYDLILMDINMPVKNGIEATREIRKFNKIIPIIALTAVEIEEQKYQIFESGMNDIILKPYDIDIFKNTIIKNLTPVEINELRKHA